MLIFLTSDISSGFLVEICFMTIIKHLICKIICIWQDVYFDDESAEVVISSLRLGDDHER